MEEQLNKGMLHLNDKGISSFVKNVRKFLSVSETVWHWDSSSLSGSLSQSKAGNDFWWIKQQWIEHAKTP